MLNKIIGYLLVFVFLFVSVVSAATMFTVAWDPNSEPDLAGYRIYMDEVLLSPDIPCTANDAVCCTWTSNYIPTGPHVLHATAYDIYGNESSPSNTLDFLSEIGPPQNLRFAP